MITLKVNGKPQELDAPTRLEDFLEARGMTERRIAFFIKRKYRRSGVL